MLCPCLIFYFVTTSMFLYYGKIYHFLGSSILITFSMLRPFLIFDCVTTFIFVYCGKICHFCGNPMYSAWSKIMNLFFHGSFSLFVAAHIRGAVCYDSDSNPDHQKILIGTLSVEPPKKRERHRGR